MPKAAGAKTLRRRKRVKQQVEQSMDKVATPARLASTAPGPAVGPMAAKEEEPEPVVDPVEFSMVKFAEKCFNDHPKGGSGSLKRSGSTKMKAITNPMPKAEMVTFSKVSTLPTSLIHMHDPENVNLACSIFKDLNKYVGSFRA